VEDHHVYLNLGTRKFYCLPDNYQIIDPSLEDIAYFLNPVYTADVMKTVNDPRGSDGMLTCKALDGTQFTPGIVGINNLKANDYANVALQILVCVTPFRDFFLLENELAISKDPLVVTFGELFRKMCNPRNFKNHVSPHEFLQAVVTASKKRFTTSKQCDPFDFLYVSIPPRPSSFLSSDGNVSLAGHRAIPHIAMQV
jgi:U4/U6.U5 tri-snRNP-associated protein 2